MCRRFAKSYVREERCGGRHMGALRLHIFSLSREKRKGGHFSTTGRGLSLYGRLNKEKQKSGGAWVLSCDSNFPMPPLSAARCRCGLVVLALRVRSFSRILRFSICRAYPCTLWFSVSATCRLLRRIVRYCTFKNRDLQLPGPCSCFAPSPGSI